MADNVEHCYLGIGNERVEIEGWWSDHCINSPYDWPWAPNQEEKLIIGNNKGIS